MNGSGPAIVITGASRGIGAAVARLAAERGFRVCVNYNSHASAAEAIVADICARGGQAFAFGTSTGDDDGVKDMFAAVHERFGGLDALVNNAGIYGEPRAIEEISVDELRAIFSVNVIGYFLCAREAFRLMSRANGGRGGRIVNVSSIAGSNGGSQGRCPYAATKGAVNTLSLGLSKEGAPLGITSNVFSPGLTRTELNPPGRVERLETSIPLGRAGTPEEMAAGILWLLSEEAAYCTGMEIKMSGGR